jgi:DNA-binding PadR family transcriptional regulator
MWFLEPILLLLLHHGPARGYTLIDQLGRYELPYLHPSVVYRNLRNMEAKRWVTSNWDIGGSQGPPRRVYRLASLGDEIPRAYVDEVESAQTRITDQVNAYHRHIEEGPGDYHGK